MSIFTQRTNYKPFEYPKILEFTDHINNNFWVHSEIDFTADIQDFKTKLSEGEKEAVKKSLLAIAQIEVNVKSFWGDLYKHLPKPEFNGLGATFAESEFRHSQAYSRLLEVLDYNGEFEKVIEVPVIKNRIEYLKKALEHTKSKNKKDYVFSLVLFAILIENVSLFSQFAIILSFTRFKGLMKNVSNIIAWTSIDEQIHANAGIYIINQILEEFPEFLNEHRKQKMLDIIKHSMEVEESILDWIFQWGELENVKKEDLIYFMKSRLDSSLKQIKLKPIYNVSNEDYKKMIWFDEEIQADVLDDFFAKRPVSYTKHDKPITGSDLF